MLNGTQWIDQLTTASGFPLKDNQIFNQKFSWVNAPNMHFLNIYLFKEYDPPIPGISITTTSQSIQEWTR